MLKTKKFLFFYLCLLFLSLPFTLPAQVPKEFRGKWGPGRSCKSPLSLLVTKNAVSLVNNKDTISFGDILISHSYGYGNTKEGISVWLLPEFNSDKKAPFTVTFNSNERKGVTTVEDLVEKLKKRFPMNNVALRKCSK